MRKIILALLVMTTASTAQADCQAALGVQNNHQIAFEKIKNGNVTTKVIAEYSKAKELYGYVRGAITYRRLHTGDSETFEFLKKGSTANKIWTDVFEACEKQPDQDFNTVLVERIEETIKNHKKS